MNAINTRKVDICGDILEITWDGNVWVALGYSQHARAEDAMRLTIERYLADCGDDIEDEAVQAQIDGYLSQMTD